MSKSALIFGASGVSGWSFVNEILEDYPKPGIWKRVHALTNRPLQQKDSLWPVDERLNLVSGIDLTAGTQEELQDALRKAIPDIAEVTHVYYLAYKASTDLQQELKDAVSMFKRAVTAMDVLSPALEFVVLQLGAKMYGCHLLQNHPTDYIHVPLSEDQPRLKQPYHDQLFYHPQIDWITSYAKDKKWNWCETRPDIIVGFVPNQNAHSMGTSLGIFLSLYAEIEGKGASCSFPGTDKTWNVKSNDASSDMIARQTIHLSLNLPEKQKGEGFNVADAKHYETWSTRWPILCSYFGLKGTPPSDEASLEVGSYIQNNIDTWKRMEKQYGLKSGIADSDISMKGIEYFLLTMFDFDRHYDMAKMYSTGFEEERSIQQSWGGVFDRMRKGKLIP